MQQTGSNSQGRILVVDDNLEAAELLTMLLEIQHYETRIAISGVSGLEEARRFKPHVICSDIGMPHMDGFEFAKLVKRGTLSDSLLVAITGWGDDVTTTRTKEAGFDLHLTKPVDYEQLIARIRTFFQENPPD